MISISNRMDSDVCLHFALLQISIIVVMFGIEYQSDQNWHMEWVTGCKVMFQFLEDKNPSHPCFYKSRMERWGEELGQVSISLNGSLVIFWSSISSKCNCLKFRVLCRVTRAETEQLQMADRHRGVWASRSSCPASVPTGAPGLHFCLSTALCSYSSLKQRVERTFFPLYLMSLCKFFHRKAWYTPKSALFLGKM